MGFDLSLRLNKDLLKAHTVHWHEDIIKCVYFRCGKLTISSYFAIQCLKAPATFVQQRDVGLWVGCRLSSIAVGLWAIRSLE